MFYRFENLITDIKSKDFFHRNDIDVYVNIYVNTLFFESLRISCADKVWENEIELYKLFYFPDQNFMFSYCFINSKSDIYPSEKDISGFISQLKI